MRNITLSDSEKKDLEHLHRNTKDVRVAYRVNAILLRNDGWSISFIAQVLIIHETSISRFIDDYLNQNKKLKPENGGSCSSLNKEQTKDLIAHLEENIYPTSNAIKEYIFNKWNVEYTITGLIKWLNKHQFRYKKPVGVPRKANLEDQKKFTEYYNSLRDSISNEKEVILFIDSVHPSQNTKLAYGWIKKGTDKAIETTASRTRLNIVGAINLQNLSEPIFSKFDTINKESIIEFLQKIRHHYMNKDHIHIILDGAGYHKAIDVKNIANNLNIELHFLPPYSPNLNPIERLWKVMNEKARNNKYFSSKSHFVKAKMNFYLAQCLRSERTCIPE